MKNRFVPVALAAMLGIAALTNGCGEDGLTGGLCCTDFKVGADLTGVDFGVDASIKGQFEVFAQAGADFSASAAAALDDVGGACKAIASDLGADLSSANGLTGRAAVSKYCELAVGQIQANLTAAGTLTVSVQGPKCSASVDAKVNCSAKCSVDGSCTGEAAAPKCEGGKLPSVQCDGKCEVEGSASISCTGGCTGECSGSCEGTATAGVECDGSCDGNCEAAAGGSTAGSGLQADGSCKGSCKGKCTMRAPEVKVKCSGTCSGSCTAACEAKGGVSARCDGKCVGSPGKAPKCEGGKVEVACKVDANCDANCDASVSAKAECTPPRVAISASGGADAKVQAFIRTLELNLPNLLLVFQARGQAFVKTGEAFASATVKIAADPGKLNVEGVACAAAIVSVAAEAAANAKGSVEASASVAGALKIGPG